MCCVLSSHRFSNACSNLTEMGDFSPNLLSPLKIHSDSEATPLLQLYFHPFLVSLCNSRPASHIPEGGFNVKQALPLAEQFLRGDQTTERTVLSGCVAPGDAAPQTKQRCSFEHKNATKYSTDKVSKVAVIPSPAIIRWSTQISLD